MSETRSLLGEIRQAIADGRIDDARDMLERLSAQLEQLAEGLGAQLSGGAGGDEALAELLDQTMKGLAELRADQDALADELAAERRRGGGDFDSLLDAWEEVAVLARESAEQSSAALGATLDGRGWRPRTLRQLGVMDAAVGSMRDAALGRDAADALRSAEDARALHAGAVLRVDEEARRGLGEGRPPPLGLSAAQTHLGELGSRLERIESLLRRLAEARGEESDALRERARQLAARQEDLRARETDLERDVREVESAMPMSDGEASAAMERAREMMERAAEALQYGEATAGEGLQRDGAEWLGTARESLERQADEHRRMQAAMRQMRGESGDGGGERSDSGEGQGRSLGTFLPEPEQFQTPEAYRRALLEGMEGEVPDGYRAQSRRYYEDLVRQ